MPSKPFDPFKIPTEREQLIVQYGTQAQQNLYDQYNFRGMLEYMDRAYQRELDWTDENIKARKANMSGDPTKFQDMTVPIVMPQVESALGYFVNVFLTGYPIFGVAGGPEVADAALQLETIVGENTVTGRWIPQLMMAFRDALKYNLMGLELEWQTKKMTTAKEDLTSDNNAKSTELVWRGNVIKRMDLYNTFFDPRVAPSEVHEKGEFAGYTEIISRVQLAQLMSDMDIPTASDLSAKVFKTAYPGGQTSTDSSTPYNYYVPSVNPFPFMEPFNRYGTNWMAWAGMEKRAGKGVALDYGNNMYARTRLYARIIPEMFGYNVEGKTLPQVWKFEIINGTCVIKAERLTNNHNFIPIVFGQPFEDGLGMQTKSFASNVVDYQMLASAMWNGFIASKRRLIGDRALYDPSRVAEKDINSRNPAAKIPVRPGAYGKPVGEAVYQFPFRDEQTNSFLQGSDAVVRLANMANNQNPAQQGQFVKGNKTVSEFEDIMGHGNAGNMKMALSIEHQVLVPIKKMLLLNMLQYQQQTTLYNQNTQQMVPIKPAEIRAVAVQFKVSDGILPTDKLMSTQEYGMLFQLISTSPQVAADYNIGELVSYLMKLKQVDLKPFEKSDAQKQYEQQMAAWQQMASLAIQKGATFNTPMPQPPQEPPQTEPSARAKALSSTVTE